MDAQFAVGAGSQEVDMQDGRLEWMTLQITQYRRFNLVADLQGQNVRINCRVL